MIILSDKITDLSGEKFKQIDLDYLNIVPSKLKHCKGSRESPIIAPYLLYVCCGC